MNSKKLLLFVLALALMGGTAGLLARMKHKLGNPGVRLVAEPLFDEDGKIVGTNRVELPAVVLDYESKLLPVIRKDATALPADTTFGRREYRAPDGFEARLDVVLMGADRTSIHKPQICLYAQGWSIAAAKSSLVNIPVSQPQPYELQVMKLLADKTIQSPDGREVRRRAVFAYWFVADGVLTARHDTRMWAMARELLHSGVLQRWAYVTCLSICKPGEEEKTFERMKELIAAAVPEFQLTPKTTNLLSSATPIIQ